MNVIVDASVAVKWFVDEVGSAQALDLRASHTIAAPDILLIECHNAFLNKVRRQTMSRDRAIQLENVFSASAIEIFSSTPFLSDAFRIALDLGGAIYDCIYVAAAIATDRVLVTADERLMTKVATSSLATDRVKLLSDFASGA